MKIKKFIATGELATPIDDTEDVATRTADLDTVGEIVGYTRDITVVLTPDGELHGYRLDTTRTYGWYRVALPEWYKGPHRPQGADH